MANKSAINNLLKTTKNNLIVAKEEYLFARGWIKSGSGHYTPDKNLKISCFVNGDKMFLNEAMKVQEEIDRVLK